MQKCIMSQEIILNWSLKRILFRLGCTVFKTVPWINPDFAKDYGEVISFKLAIDDLLYPFMDMPYESFSIDGFYEKLEEIKSICRKL